MISDEYADVIRVLVRDEVSKVLGNVKSPFVYGTFVAAEGADANLSQVTLAGDASTARFVPKGAHVTGLVAGSVVLMVKGPSVPLTIVARIVGDITLASV